MRWERMPSSSSEGALMPSSTRTRRLGGLTGVAVIAGLGLVSLSAGGAQAAEANNLQYSCKALGGAVDVGTWTADVTADLPASIKVGEKITGPKIDVTVTTSTGAADLMRNLGIKSISGTAVADYTASVPMKAELSLPDTAVPASGSITTKASGKGEDLTGTKAGNVPVTVGNFSVALKAKKADDTTQDLSVDCTIAKPAALATIKVLPAATTTPPTTTEPTTSEPTTTAPTTTTTTEPTTTSEPTTTAPTSSDDTSEPSGPPVQTDDLATSGNAAAAGLGVLALSGAAAATVIARRRLK